jgi:hypothetical protein
VYTDASDDNAPRTAAHVATTQPTSTDQPLPETATTSITMSEREQIVRQLADFLATQPVDVLRVLSKNVLPPTTITTALPVVVTTETEQAVPTAPTITAAVTVQTTSTPTTTTTTTPIQQQRPQINTPHDKQPQAPNSQTHQTTTK